MEKATTKMANTDPNYYEISNEPDNEGIIQQQGQFEMEVTDQQSSQKRKKWSIIIPVIVVVSLQLLTLLVIIILFATSSCNCSQEGPGLYTGGLTSQNDITELKQIISSIAELPVLPMVMISHQILQTKLAHCNKLITNLITLCPPSPT